MFLDASAVIAILNREAGSDELVKILDASDKAFFSPLSRFESIVGLARSRSGQHKASTPEQIDAARQAVDQFLAEAQAKSIMISDTMGADALKAAQTYGKAVGHPAELNMGDCFAYAGARAYRVRILYKGNDFAQTDLA